MENRRPSPFPSYPPDRPRVRRYRVEPPPEDHPVRDAFVGMAAALAAAVVVAVLLVATVAVARGAGPDPSTGCVPAATSPAAPAPGP